MINPQMANPQVSRRYSTTLSQKSPKSRLLHYHYVQIVIGALYAIFVSPQIAKKIWSASRKSTNTLAEGPQI